MLGKLDALVEIVHALREDNPSKYPFNIDITYDPDLDACKMTIKENGFNISTSWLEFICEPTVKDALRRVTHRAVNYWNHMNTDD